MKIITIDISELGNRSYLVHDGSAALIIDPSRRNRQLLDLAKQEHVTIQAIFETHIHNDYVTGGYALARKLGVPYYVAAEDNVDFQRTKIASDETVSVGKLQVTALASPGHTPHHLSYLVKQSGVTPTLFSGGSLLYGAVGRTDLVSAETTRPLAKAQYQTAQRFLERLDLSTQLYPTHGFGSFCAATDTEHVAVSTLQQQLKTNQAYLAKDETSFVERLLSNLDDHPGYYAHMAPTNLQGPLEPDLKAPTLLTEVAVRRALHSGTAIVDMRSRLAYAAEHLPGTYNIELSNDLATYVGWLLEWDEPFLLVAPTAAQVAIAQEQLSLIGREIVAGQARPRVLLKSVSRTVSYSVRSFADLAAALPNTDIEVIDVRRRSEWQKGHLPEARHIPLHELSVRLEEVAAAKELWVHCASGFRASIAASIISGQGKAVTLIDDDYANALKAGLLPVEKQAFVHEILTGHAQLLDVRNDSEWQSEHAQGALHIPLSRLLDGDTGPLEEAHPVYIYCQSGERSGTAESILDSYGFQAVNIGGLSDWVQAGGALES